MEQTKALNALEPFLALAKSASAPQAAADLVTRATSNPNTYVFAELLQTPQIQALAQSPDHAAYLHQLQIFSYGTYASYASTAGLPALNDAQTRKLRQLSLLTLARDPHSLSYSALQSALNLPDARAVEDLIISAVYAGLIDAQLDPRAQQVHVSSLAPLRDLAPGAVPPALQALQAWSGRCDATLADLEAQIAEIRAASARRHDERVAWDASQARLVEEEKALSTAEQQQGQQGGVHSRKQGGMLRSALAAMQGGGAGGNRFGKRSSGSLDAAAEEDEAMDLDEEEPDDGEGSSGGGTALGGPGKKRANRRKM
ncbi:PCI domain-containing protein [Xylariomycetidae sp. FL0641]|nr:PCI domain-containing protein [Xylariomycetidae sp. FL0641]